ncbi:MAG TPA: hypothetical protein VFW66_12065 [Gemmatimonadales bacterium]|nr:hypothetical protein [Gemmatimonadales bacterium]
MAVGERFVPEIERYARGPQTWRVRRLVAVLGAVSATVLVACGGEPRSLDAGWFGGPPSAAARDLAPPAADSTQLAMAAVDPSVWNDASAHSSTDAAPHFALRAASHRSSRTSADPADPPPPSSRAARSRRGRGLQTLPPADLHSTLLHLRSLEAGLFAIGRTYTADPESLGYAPEPGASVNMIWASKWGWAAVARDTAQPDRVCTMYMGAVPHSGAAAGRVDDGKAGVANCSPATGSPGHWVAYPELLLRDSARASLARGAATLMRHDLVKLVLSQRAHHAMQGIYAIRIDPMSLHYAWHPGVMLRILSADAQGWSAEATYDEWPGHSCVIWAGEVKEKPASAADSRTANKEAVPVCDE